MKFVALPVLFLVLIGGCEAKLPSGVKESSVFIETATGVGSGVIFKNGERTFIWTDAHVLTGVRTIKKNDGVLSATYLDVLAVQVFEEEGRTIGRNYRLAKIIKCSEEEDVAVLAVYQKNYGKASINFAKGVPAEGDLAWHCGSMFGEPGIGTVSKGAIGGVGKLRRGFAHNDFNRPFIYDVYCGTAHKGSSGGGVFNSKGDCLGLVTEFMGSHEREGHTHGAVCISPARRLFDFAKKNKIEYAINRNVKVPNWGKVLEQEVTVGKLPEPSVFTIQIPFPKIEIPDESEAEEKE